MLTNSQIYLCSDFKTGAKARSPIQKINTVPKNLERTSPETFLYCDIEANKTRILESNLNGQIQQIQQVDGVYTSWDFSNDHGLLLNKEGDLLFYNFLSKNTFLTEKQHPGLYVDAQIMHTNEHFITCGGCVKNPVTFASERIIKVWKVEDFDSLTQKARLNTGHKRAIEHSFLMNKTHVVSFSSDKSIRFSNIAVEEITTVVETNFEPLTGCQLDYNSVISGGNYKSLKMFDLRLKKGILGPIPLKWDLVQVVNMLRFTDHQILISNINQLHVLDLRTWGTMLIGEYDGERISSILTLNKRDFVVGNKEKTFQVWEAF